MIAVVTIVSAFGLGWFLTSVGAARTTYAVLYLWSFVFQSVYLLVDTMGGGTDSFVPGEFPLSYGVITLVIFAVGFGLVEAGHRLRHRRRAAAATAT